MGGTKRAGVFELLLENSAIADLYPPKREHEALRKRLERARKFVLLTECFSISINSAGSPHSQCVKIQI